MADQAQQSEHPSHHPRRSRSRAAVLIPAASFLFGLLIGAVVVAVGQNGGSTPNGSATPSVSAGSPTSAATGDVVVTVPAACRQASENLRTATTLLRSSVESFRTFDAQEIVDLLNRLEKLDRRTRPLVTECSKVEVDTSSSGATAPSSVATATASSS